MRRIETNKEKGCGHCGSVTWSYGVEFEVKLHGRRIDLPETANSWDEDLKDEHWWILANDKREQLIQDLREQGFSFVGKRSAFVGRGPGWLAIEDCCPPEDQAQEDVRADQWEEVGKIVLQYLKEFISEIEDPETWK